VNTQERRRKYVNYKPSNFQAHVAVKDEEDACVLEMQPVGSFQS